MWGEWEFRVKDYTRVVGLGDWEGGDPLKKDKEIWKGRKFGSKAREFSSGHAEFEMPIYPVQDNQEAVRYVCLQLSRNIQILDSSS